MVDSAHRLSSLHYKVATRILRQLCFTMFFLLLNQLFHRCLVYLCNLVYVSCKPCGEVGTSTFTPPVYFSHLQSSNLRLRQDVPRIVKSICGTVFTFWCGQCPKCRTVVSLGVSIRWSRHMDFQTSCLLCEFVNELYRTSPKNSYRFVEL